jgi:co-chaperonin GroES (HSP10)
MKQVLNNNVIVQIKNTVALNNGINLKETRGKRDIITGVIYLVDETTGLVVGDIVWFPLYASNEIVVDGIQLAVLNIEDIVMVDKDAKY